MTRPSTDLASPANEADEADATVSFTEMQHGTAADYALLDRYERQHASELADRLLDVLARLREEDPSTLVIMISGHGTIDTAVDATRKGAYDFLQNATRARLDGADIDWVVAALLHDIGDELAPYNHAEYAAAVLRPYVREEVAWVVEHHGVFQSYYFAHHLGGDRNRRDQFADHPWFDLCVEFCARWDQNSFDPEFPIHGLDTFADDVRTVFARSAWSDEVIGAGPATLVE